MENEMRRYMDKFKQRLNESSDSMDHNFSIYDDIESELVEIPNDEAVEYLMGIIKHCEKLIEKVGEEDEDYDDEDEY